MKKRQGFVSNSSTTSFVLHGACVDKDILKDKLREMHKDDGPEDKKELEEGLENYGLGEFEGDIGKLLPGKLIMDGPDEYSDVAYIGRRYTSMEDDETYGEFKASIVQGLKEFLGDEKKISIAHIQEASADY